MAKQPPSNTSSSYCWEPTREWIEAANVTRLMRRHGLSNLAELHARSVTDSSWFWEAVIEDLGVEFHSEWSSVMDRSAGPEWPRWFPDALVNVAWNAVYRHATGHRSSAIAISWEGEEGAVRQLSYKQLGTQVAKLAGALDGLGVRQGDRVALFLPMLPEAIVSVFACASIGAIAVPIFSGFGADAVRARLEDAGAGVMITADGFQRRGKLCAMKEVADNAASAAGVERMIVVRRNSRRVIPWTQERDLWWHEVIEKSRPRESVPLNSEAPFLIAYTSGTTGRPKGVVHVHGGFLVKAVEEYAYELDVHSSDRLHWVSDMGWIVGPWQAVAVASLGATLVLYDGAPDWPNPDRLWRLVERHHVTCLGLSPTLVRTLRGHGDQWLRLRNLTALRVLATTGEPIDLESYLWLFERVGGGRCPIINLSGGTEVGGSFLAPHPVAPLKATSLQGPALGMDVEIWDEDGRPAPAGDVGHLVCKQPWPAMTRGFWNDTERYLKTYWRRWPGVWFHGDWAKRDVDGQWYLLGRSDDTIKVAGKRVAPAEIESILASHPSVLEAAVVGMPDAVKGQALWCYCVLKPGEPATDKVRDELTELVVERLGGPFRPAQVRFVKALPKTRTGKVMRTAVHAAASGTPSGDLSSLEDVSSLEAIRDAC